MIRAEVGACFGRSFEMARIDVEVVARIFPADVSLGESVKIHVGRCGIFPGIFAIHPNDGQAIHRIGVGLYRLADPVLQRHLRAEKHLVRG